MVLIPIDEPVLPVQTQSGLKKPRMPHSAATVNHKLSRVRPASRILHPHLLQLLQLLKQGRRGPRSFLKSSL